LAVLVDLDLLRGLPTREVRSGLAEVVKAGFIADSAILDLIIADPQDCLEVTSDRFAQLLVRAVKVKADAVADDLKERTSVGESLGRERLNYGHTMAHAIETHEHFQWRHGEAVAVGMVYAAELASATIGLDADAVALHREVLSSLSLPTSYAGAPFAQLRAYISRDKKTRGVTPRFVLLDRLQHPVIATPTEDTLSAAYQRIAR
jgi:3-dehydroquinate synthase/shikimate kinase/3-dehydroquinate synthase